MEKRKAKRDETRRSQAFRSTNGMWNYLLLNQGWSIGMMMKIIGNKRFKSFEEWEKYYLESGRDRQKALNKLPEHKRAKLQDLRGHHTNPKEYRNGLTQDEARINDAMGRTIEDMEFLAATLYDEVKKTGNPYKLTLEDCATYVYIRIVDEIYIGIQREENTLITLEKEFPELRFKKAKTYIDRTYAIDAEVYNKRDLICGLQIKSPYYLIGRTDEMRKSLSYNEKKMQNYREKFDTEAYFVYSEVTGEIKNPEILTTIRELLTD